MFKSLLRVSIRDVLWLTLVAGMAAGWYVHQRQLNTEIQKAQAWRQRAGALEYMLNGVGWSVSWDFASSQVHASRFMTVYGPISTVTHEPSADPP